MPTHTFFRDKRDRFTVRFWLRRGPVDIRMSDVEAHAFELTASTFAVAELISLVFQRRILRGFGQRRKLRRVLEEVRRG